LIDERGKDDTWVGRNFAYKPVVVQSQEDLFGEFVSVRVDDVFPTYLEAEVFG